MSNGAGKPLPGFDGLWALCASSVKYENNRQCPQCQAPLLERGTTYARCSVSDCLTVVDTSRGLTYTRVA